MKDCPKLPMPCPNKCEKKLVIKRDQVRRMGHVRAMVYTVAAVVAEMK